MKKIAVLFGVLILMVVIVSLIAALQVPSLRSQLVDFLSARTGRSVEMASLRWSLLPRLSFVGRDLRIAGQPPETEDLIRVDSFTVKAALWRVLRSPRRIDSLDLEGVRIHVPESNHPAAVPKNVSEQRSSEQPAALTIDRITASDVIVETEGARAGDAPRQYHLDRLELDSVALDREISFLGNLRTPVLTGDLEVQGTFGPWNNARPKQTPLAGTYGLSNGDLARLGGIGGTVSSRGDFGGEIENVQVAGDLQVPDFFLAKVRKPTALTGIFKVLVQDSARALDFSSFDIRFGSSRLTGSGTLAGSATGKDRTLRLQTEARDSRVEDFLALAVQAQKPPLEGGMELRATLRIPPGSSPVMDRLVVSGDFLVQQGRFRNLDLQKTIETLSRIGGKSTEGQSGGTGFSEMSGDYRLENSKLHFSRLSFQIPGTEIQLTGNYDLNSEGLDFRGKMLLARAPSELVPEALSGWVKLIDPLFRRGEAGTTLPIRITGTRSKPSFGLDLGGR